MKRICFLCTFILLLLVTSLTKASSHVTWVREYDPTLGEFPEGIAIDKTENIFVSIQSEIRKITPDGTESLYYQFDPSTKLVGLAVDAPGNLYVCVFVPPPGDPTGLKGVWRINPAGEAVHLAGSDAIGLPNALAFDQRGNLYVSDSYVFGSIPPQGAIWRIPSNGVAEIWLQDSALLGGLGGIPGYPPLGANGIAFHHNGLYIANTERSLVSHVPILPDGSPGVPTIVHESQNLFMIDGIALDVHGMIYAALIGQDRIVTVDPETGTVNEIAGASDDVNGPASLAFGTGEGDRKTAYFTNYSVISANPNPGVLKMDVAVPGLPLP